MDVFWYPNCEGKSDPLGEVIFQGWLFWDDQEAGGAQLAHRHVFGFKSGVKGNMHFTDDAHLLQHDRAQGLGPDQKEFPTHDPNWRSGFDSLNYESLVSPCKKTANLDR